MTPQAINLLGQIHARGVDVQAIDGNLRLNPAGICRDLLPAIRQHKADLLALLTIDPWEAAEPWPHFLRPLRQYVPRCRARRPARCATRTITGGDDSQGAEGETPSDAATGPPKGCDQ